MRPEPQSHGDGRPAIAPAQAKGGFGVGERRAFDGVDAKFGSSEGACAADAKALGDGGAKAPARFPRFDFFCAGGQDFALADFGLEAAAGVRAERDKGRCPIAGAEVFLQGGGDFRAQGQKGRKVRDRRRCDRRRAAGPSGVEACGGKGRARWQTGEKAAAEPKEFGASGPLWRCGAGAQGETRKTVFEGLAGEGFGLSGIRAQ